MNNLIINSSRRLSSMKEYFLPKNDGKFNSNQRNDFDSLITITLVLLFISIFWVVYCYSIGLVIMSMGCMFNIPFLISALFILKLKSKPLLAGHIILFSTFINLAVVHYASGLGSAPSIFWLGFYPVFAVVIVGERWAYFWSIAMVFFVIISELWRHNTGHSYTEYTPQLLFWTNIANLSVGIPFLCFFVGYAYKIKNQALEEKEGLISAMSHDLANPVSGLSFALYNVKKAEKSKNKERLDISIKQLEKVVFRMNNTIETIRGFRKVGFFEVNPVPWGEIQELLEEKFNVDLKNKSLTIKYDITEYRNKPFFGNLNVIVNHVLQNLIENAIKFSYSGGEIIVKVVTLEHSSLIIVKDKGIGIKDTSKVMSGTFTTTGVLGEIGSGLGLTAAKMHLDRILGSLEVKSEMGSGSSFTVTLENWEKKYE